MLHRAPIAVCLPCADAGRPAKAVALEGVAHVGGRLVGEEQAHTIFGGAILDADAVALDVILAVSIHARYC